ncbi:AAA family ATPase [Haliscomenobacter sp.]|uniref:AAA family ATPase n=1 Tax=Haliscomenobacter sp. TaxID=2717303 RepID=UPI003BABC3B3
MNQIIGRKAELEILQSTIESTQSEFIAVTGRRRIGKTYLVNTFFKDDICFYLTGVQNQPIKVQLQAFASELSRRKQSFVSAPADWMEAFAVLRDYVETVKTKRKKVIFFDELSWIETQRSGFLQIFAHFWNSWAAWEKNIVLVVAGSSTSWIIKKVYNDTGGLHNRVTKRIWLEPFKLAETEAFLKQRNIALNRYDIALLYMTFGGVPFYLNELKAGESAAQNIERLCFSDAALLQNEFENLYASIFRQAELHLRIVRTLARSPYGMERAELLKMAKIDNSGTATKVLEELIATGYVHYLLPLGKKSNGGKYILADFFSRFYVNFMANRQSADWMSQIESHAYKSWCGIAFEWLCHFHKKEILKALGISGIRTSISYLTLKDESGKMAAQIDMLIDRADNVVNLCEIKFANDVYALTKSEANNIRNKMTQLRAQLKKRKSIFPVMITTFGCEKNMHYLGLIHNQVELDDLF